MFQPGVTMMVNQVLETTNEKRKPSCLAFIGYENALDAAETVPLINATRELDVGETFYIIIEDICT